MMIHTEISPAEQADRLAIRELVDAYAHCARSSSPLPSDPRGGAGVLEDRRAFDDKARIQHAPPTRPAARGFSGVLARSARATHLRSRRRAADPPLRPDTRAAIG